MRFTKWLKTWGALLVATIALALSGLAIWLDNTHYQEVTKPQAEHTEVFDRLVRLDYKIERVEQNITTARDSGQDVSAAQKEIVRASELRNRAELSWDAGHYTEADKLISEAHTVLAQTLSLIIPPPTPAVNWLLIGGIIAAAIIITVVIVVVIRRQQA